MSGETVKKKARVTYAILDDRVTVGEGAQVGEDRGAATEIAVVGADVKVPSGAKIPAGAMISEQQ